MEIVAVKTTLITLLYYAVSFLERMISIPINHMKKKMRFDLLTVLILSCLIIKKLEKSIPVME